VPTFGVDPLHGERDGTVPSNIFTLRPPRRGAASHGKVVLYARGRVILAEIDGEKRSDRADIPPFRAAVSGHDKKDARNADNVWAGDYKDWSRQGHVLRRRDGPLGASVFLDGPGPAVASRARTAARVPRPY